MTKAKPRGRPFPPGNPGRPTGSRNKSTELIEQLAEGQAEQLFQKVVELAQAGNVACLRMLLDRVCPPRKGQPVHFVVPPIKSAQDVPRVIAAIWTAIQQGQITPDEAADLSIVVDRTMHAIELHDVIRRISALEQKREKSDGQQNNSSPA
jgi:hypothetical protein